MKEEITAECDSVTHCKHFINGFLDGTRFFLFFVFEFDLKEIHTNICIRLL